LNVIGAWVELKVEVSWAIVGKSGRAICRPPVAAQKSAGIMSVVPVCSTSLVTVISRAGFVLEGVYENQFPVIENVSAAALPAMASAIAVVSVIFRFLIERRRSNSIEVLLLVAARAE
jgi:hypothetical protein